MDCHGSALAFVRKIDELEPAAGHFPLFQPIITIFIEQFVVDIDAD